MSEEKQKDYIEIINFVAFVHSYVTNEIISNINAITALELLLCQAYLESELSNDVVVIRMESLIQKFKDSKRPSRNY
jgi:hypothetical protein